MESFIDAVVGRERASLVHVFQQWHGGGRGGGGGRRGYFTGGRFLCVVSVNITIDQHDGSVAEGGAALLALDLVDFLVWEGRG